MLGSGSFESGTAATIVELQPPIGHGPEAIDIALDLDTYLTTLSSAPDLTISDLWLTAEDQAMIWEEFTFQAISILLDYGGESFKQYKKCKGIL